MYVPTSFLFIFQLPLWPPPAELRQEAVGGESGFGMVSLCPASAVSSPALSTDFTLPPPPARLCPWYERNYVPWWTHGPSPAIPAKGGELTLESVPCPLAPSTLDSWPCSLGCGKGGRTVLACGALHSGCHRPALGSSSSPLPFPPQLCPSSLSSGTTFFLSPFLLKILLI